MSDQITKLSVFNDVESEQVINAINWLYASISPCSNKKFGIFGTKDGKVYGIGDNSTGQLGLGHNKSVNDHQEVDKLNNVKIIEFIDGNCCMYAKTEDNRAFSWGGNAWGQLGRDVDRNAKKYHEPAVINFNGKDIISVCAGNLHTLALTSDGQVYGWGNNNYGQIRAPCKEVIGLPFLLELEPFLLPGEKVVFIYCYSNCSFAISRNTNTSAERLLTWGQFTWGLGKEFDAEIIAPPRHILTNFNKFDNLICSDNFIYFLSKGKLHYSRTSYGGIVTSRDYRHFSPSELYSYTKKTILTKEDGKIKRVKEFFDRQAQFKYFLIDGWESINSIEDYYVKMLNKCYQIIQM